MRADRVDEYVAAQLKQYNVPGLSLAVVKRGRVIKSKGYGLANVELNARATPDTVYQWASVTKQFTAAAVLLLADDGKLKLDERIGVYLAKTPAAWSNVTVWHLLNHTSGIKSYTGLPGFFKDIRKDFKQDELIALVRDLPLEFEPGARWSYNNTGYFLLGLIIEKTSGLTYGDFLQKRIFGPLAMTTARVNEQFLIITNRATGYSSVSNRLFTSEFVSPTQPYSAGALAGTVLDLAKWDAALYVNRVLSAANRQLMWTPTRLNDGKTRDYGFGWELGELFGHRYVAHGGGIHGFSTYILRLVEDKLTVIVLMNGPGNSSGVAQGVADYYVPGLLISSIKPRRDPDPLLSERLKQCLRDLAATNDSPLITAEFRENYAKARGRAESLAGRLKEMKWFTFVTSVPAPASCERWGVPISRLAYYKLVSAKETRFYTFELTADEKVAFYQSSEQ
jgi:CubicO group peptidase (beta-lactamase class C family)